MRAIYLFLLVFLCPAFSFAEDIAGSKDPAGIKRYEGSSIVRFEQVQFGSFQVPLGKMTKFDFGNKVAEFEKSETLEGQINRVTYHVPDPLRSSLEVFRNYEEALKSDGWTIVWQASGKPEFGNAYAHIYESLRDNDQLLTYNDQGAYALTAKKEAEGLTALLFVTKFEMGLTRGLKIGKGDPLVQLDVIQTKAMESKMVVPTASEMSKSINESGRIALYGILFDFNSAAIKPESQPTLEQIGALLKEQPSLKLLVVGHTDNVGEFEFNRELSQKRASAVVDALVSGQGAEQSRLKSFGVSFAAPVASNQNEDGRAKNRRVELVEIAGTTK